MASLCAESRSRSLTYLSAESWVHVLAEKHGQRHTDRDTRNPPLYTGPNFLMRPVGSTDVEVMEATLSWADVLVGQPMDVPGPFSGGQSLSGRCAEPGRYVYQVGHVPYPNATVVSPGGQEAAALVERHGGHRYALATANGERLPDLLAGRHHI